MNLWQVIELVLDEDLIHLLAFVNPAKIWMGANKFSDKSFRFNLIIDVMFLGDI